MCAVCVGICKFMDVLFYAVCARDSEAMIWVIFNVR